MEGNYRKATSEYIKILLETIDKEPAELGYKFKELTREWVEAGNRAEDFAEKGAKIVIILDNN